MTVPADPEPSALARWWWRTPVWSRLLTSVGGGFVALMVLFGLFGPKVPAQQPGAQPVVATITTTATTIGTTTTSSTAPTTTSTTTTTTEAPAPPPATHQPPPATHQPAPPPPTEAPAPPPSEPVYVTPGAFCSTEGATGVTKTGKPMVCSRTATDSRLRWRAA
ncbi:hypothetical protein [Kutzneria sp. NPDC052558]|uniref:hypothetical protein n=1 Tax=Kutzneria sp. NPDC052558 TaxID=3364121 RepID=UPI0037C9EDF9